MEEQRPLVYIYDRHVYDRETAENTLMLEQRLKECAKYATGKGWGFGGWWLDKGDRALTDNRPEFEAMLHTMQAAVDRQRFCLIHDWGRLSHDRETRGLMVRRVLLIGGWVETCDGERRTPDGGQTQIGRLTSGPVTT